jgi:hypothetical protein
LFQPLKTASIFAGISSLFTEVRFSILVSTLSLTIANKSCFEAYFPFHFLKSICRFMQNLNKFLIFSLLLAELAVKAVGSDAVNTARLKRLDVHFPGEHVERMPLVKDILFFSFPIPEPSIDTVYIRPLTEFAGEKPLFVLSRFAEQSLYLVLLDLLLQMQLC